LANEKLFGLNGGSDSKKEVEAWEKAKGYKKTEFAIEYAINDNSWIVPRYIADAIRWLAEGERCQIVSLEQSST
jgi:putative ATP-dependent endonuclease of OLD family